MNTTLKRVTAALVFIAIIVSLVIVKKLSEKTKEIPENPADTIGNTAGNLYNGGTFCEYDGVVYFSNAYDNGALYAMDPGRTNIRRIVSGQAAYINAAGGYLYYFSATASDQSGLGYVRNGRGVYRVDTKGKDNILLEKLSTDGLLLIGNNICYTNFAEGDPDDGNAVVSVDRVSTDGETTAQLILSHPKLGATFRDRLCYAGTGKDHCVYTLDPLTGSESRIADLNCYLPIPQGAYIYYLDLSDDYHLKAYSVAEDTVTELVAERIDSYNLYGDMIYYQTVDVDGEDGYALKRIRVDGSNNELVHTGVHTDIQITSDYVYFREFGNDLPMFCTPTYGAVSVSTFDAAKEAALSYSR